MNAPERYAPDRYIRPLAIAAATLLVTSIASIGQVRHATRGDDAVTSVEAGSTPSTDTGDAAVSGAEPGAAADGSGAPLAGRDPRAPRQGLPIGGSAPTTLAPIGTDGSMPDYGLRTQGVTDKQVKIGISYNVAACGDAGTLEAALGSSTTGDPKKAIDAFTRHINETGGIGGRTLKVVIVDDGGGGCPEKASAAAVKMLEEEKVFMAIPGLHVESDYLIEKKLPVFGGRDDPASLAKSGANGIMLTEAIEPTLEKWSAFGRYYLDSANHKPCLIRPESGVSGDWNSHEKLMTAKFEKFGLTFTDIITYKEDVATAQSQANTIAARAKAKGCDQVYFMAGNPIALIFFTQAATQNQWFPAWTFTSYMVLSDTELAGRLMDQRQWENAVGLSTRVPPGEHPKELQCKRTYEKYYPGDGQSESASVQIVCAQLLSSAEIMRRGVKLTGVLTGNSWIVGADAVRNDFAYDAHVPIRWSFPGPRGPFKTKGFSHWTVVKWSSSESRYLFPEYPKYWEVMGPGRSGAQDLRPSFQAS